MKKVRILFGSEEGAEKFVGAVSKLKSEFDIVCGKGGIDAKSILGLMALDLKVPLDMQCMVAEGEEKIVDAILEEYITGE